MKIYLPLLAFALLFSFGCKKKRSKENKLPSTITVIANNKTYQLTVIDQSLKISDTAEIRMYAVGADYKVDIQAKSINHVNGVGEYYLSCCNNDFWDHQSLSTHFECLRGAPIGNIETQLGYLNVVSKTEKSFEGNFSMTGRNDNDSTKSISGNIKVYF